MQSHKRLRIINKKVTSGFDLHFLTSLSILERLAGSFFVSFSNETLLHFQDTDEVQQSSDCLNCWKAAVLVEGVLLAFLAVTVGILVVEGRAKRIRKGTRK